jgi:glucans biosynthesis protein
MHEDTTLIDRRRFLGGSAVALLASLVAAGGALELIPDVVSAKDASDDKSFSRDWLLAKARSLAEKPFAPPKSQIDKRWLEINYDQYRDIRVPETARLWRNDNLPFQLDLLPAGFYFKEPVEVSIVESGQATTQQPAEGMFSYGPSISTHPDAPLPFSGFRLRNQINTSGIMDEFLVFQGASYFRAVAKGQNYGLSARGLALKTADPEGEEFPVFRAFYIEKPQPGDTTVVIHALLDTPSATGAYRFSARPGDETVVDVELTLYARKVLDRLGLAPLTSMFLFDATNRHRFDDFRPAVFDSSGLQMLNGRGEWLWRPLANPQDLQISDFLDTSPRGFGLIQRTNGFPDFQDLEARYEKRPSVWVEPIGDWGAGVVELVEIPTKRETDDNIIAFWRPRQPVPAGGSYSTSYRLHWGDGQRISPQLSAVSKTRIGRSFDQERVLVVIDFVGGDNPDVSQLGVDLSTSAGSVRKPVLQRNSETNGIRVSFEFEHQDVKLAEFRLVLKQADRPASEVWLYRWTAA